MPFTLPILALVQMSLDRQLFAQCFGHPAHMSAGLAVNPYASLARVIVAIPCSPYYVRDVGHHWFVIVLFVGGIALAVPQIAWLQRHKAYWDVIRERERQKRADKSAAHRESPSK